MRRLLHRVEGVHRAESGADFLEVYRFFLDQGYEDHDSYHQTVRIFRGSLPKRGGPFTKDLSYIRGFVLVTNYLRDVLKRGLYQAVALLFSGKTNLGDLDTLCQLANEGLVAQPRFLPPPFADLAGLSSWVFQAGGSAVAPNLAGLL